MPQYLSDSETESDEDDGDIETKVDKLKNAIANLKSVENLVVAFRASGVPEKGAGSTHVNIDRGKTIKSSLTKILYIY